MARACCENTFKDYPFRSFIEWPLSEIKDNGQLIILGHLVYILYIISSKLLDSPKGSVWLCSSFMRKMESEPWLVWLSGLSASLQIKGSPVQFPV